MLKRDAILKCLQDDEKLVEAPMSQVLAIVKKRFGVTATDKHFYQVRREYQRDQERRAAIAREQDKEEVAPQPNGAQSPAVLGPPMRLQQAGARYQEVNDTLEILEELHGLSRKVGGLEVVIALSNRMLAMGFK